MLRAARVVTAVVVIAPLVLAGAMMLLVIMELIELTVGDTL